MNKVKVIGNISISVGSKYYGIGEIIEGLPEKEIKRLEGLGYIEILEKTDFETSEMELKEKEQELIKREETLKLKEEKYAKSFDVSLEEFQELVSQKTIEELKEIAKTSGEDLQGKNKSELVKEFIGKFKGEGLCLNIN